MALSLPWASPVTVPSLLFFAWPVILSLSACLTAKDLRCLK